MSDDAVAQLRWEWWGHRPWRSCGDVALRDGVVGADGLGLGILEVSRMILQPERFCDSMVL